MSNNPPYAVLELSKEETEWLHSLLKAANKTADKNFSEIVGMSSKDPRARHRATLQVSASIDCAISENLCERLEKQDDRLSNR